MARNANLDSGKIVIINEIETVDKHDISGDKTLIVYFSWGGNAKGITEHIQVKTGADLFGIEFVDTYSAE